MVTVVAQIPSSDTIYLDILYNVWAQHYQNRPTHSFKNNLQKNTLPPPPEIFYLDRVECREPYRNSISLRF